MAEKYLGADAEFHEWQVDTGWLLRSRSLPTGAIRSDPRRESSRFGCLTFLWPTSWRRRAGDKADQLRKWFDGKIVLIGSDTVDDHYSTPFYTMFAGLRGTTPGVEIQANTIRTLLDRKYLLDGSGLGAWGRAAGSGGDRRGHRHGTGGGPRGGVGDVGDRRDFVIYAVCCFWRAGYCTTAETAVAALGCAGLSMVYRVLTAEERGNLFHRAVALFVGKEVAQSLEETAAIQLSGRRLNVTIMFTDIRGFTAFSGENLRRAGSRGRGRSAEPVPGADGRHHREASWPA